MNVPFSTLKGKTLTSVDRKGKQYDDQLTFTCSDGTVYRQEHVQDCCEAVTIEDICGDLDDLLGSPILIAEESSNNDHAANGGDSNTWTFYLLSTIKGSVTIRWWGTSNGYYSEEVDFFEVTPSERQLYAKLRWSPFG